MDTDGVSKGVLGGIDVIGDWDGWDEVSKKKELQMGIWMVQRKEGPWDGEDTVGLIEGFSIGVEFVDDCVGWETVGQIEGDVVGI